MPLRVVVAEDNLLVREGIITLLEHQSGLAVCGACDSYDDLVATVEREHPDVVVTDIRMPPTGTDEGIRAALALRDTQPGIGVVVLSQYVDPAYALALLERGSEGRAYLLKERVSDATQIVRAIEEVARGGSVIDPVVVEALVAQRQKQRSSPSARTSVRRPSSGSRRASGKCSTRWPRVATTPGSRRPCSCRNAPSRSTSIPCSRNWVSARRWTSIAG